MSEENNLVVEEITAEEKLFYDAHARNVIVDCKDGKDLESLIEDGEIGGGNSSLDPSETINILYLSTMPNMDTIADTKYTYKSIGVLQLAIGDNVIDFYAYIRNAGENDNIPVGTVIVTEFYNPATVGLLGGTWECLGRMTLTIGGESNKYYAYKKVDILSDTGEDVPE